MAAAVTTVIPVYNGERFLRATLQCIVEQELQPRRVVVIDNCSTDNTENIVREFVARLPIEWRQNETNIGSAGNLNRALTLAAEAEYLHILPADDLVKPDFYKKLVGAMETIKGRALGYTFYELIDQGGRCLNVKTIHNQSFGTRRITHREFLTNQCELRSICCPSVLHKTDFQASPAFFRTDMPQIADSVFYAEWGRACDTVVEVGEILCQNRHHSFSATASNSRNLRATVLDEWKAITLIFEMFSEPALRRWLRGQKLKCLFAARCKVKCQIMSNLDPTLVPEISRAAAETVPFPHRMLASGTVLLRDVLRRVGGQPSKASELLRLYDVQST